LQVQKPTFLLCGVTAPQSWGPKARQFERIVPEARISARGNSFHPIKLSGVVPEARRDSGTLFFMLILFFVEK
jgi:hypothetical protein